MVRVPHYLHICIMKCKKLAPVAISGFYLAFFGLSTSRLHTIVLPTSVIDHKNVQIHSFAKRRLKIWNFFVASCNEYIVPWQQLTYDESIADFTFRRKQFDMIMYETFHDHGVVFSLNRYTYI